MLGKIIGEVLEVHTRVSRATGSQSEAAVDLAALVIQGYGVCLVCCGDTRSRGGMLEI